MTQAATIDSRDWGRRFMSTARRRTVVALAEALFSTEDDTRGLVPASHELCERVADEFDLLIGAGSGDLRRMYRIFTWLIEWLPLFFLGTLARASRLPIARRLAYLDRLEHASIGLLAALFVAFKLPLTIIAFEQAPELQVTGFDRETLATPRLIAPKVPLPIAPVPARVPAVEEVGSR
jgi:hypothetical protein